MGNNDSAIGELEKETLPTNLRPLLNVGSLNVCVWANARVDCKLQIITGNMQYDLTS